ncbi:MAG: hypothetical protein HRF50_16040 [Phycisphaerae bacterium]|jgi:hypothetical protein
MFPAAPATLRTLPSGELERGYDSDGDGRVDSIEVLGADGRVCALQYDEDGDGQFELRVPRGRNAAATSGGDGWGAGRHLILILDSVPYGLVRELWNGGRFRSFAPPSRVVSPFPVMTDPCLNEFFEVSPGPGVESMYFDGRRLQSGLFNYLDQENAPWLALCDYRLPNLLHGEAYTNPEPWFDNELRKTHDRFLGSGATAYVSYSMGTSALMMQRGRNGQLAALVRLDRLCQQLLRETRGEAEITLLSDHGHNSTPSRRLPLDEHLRRMGYRVRNRLDGPDDVVVPQWGLVTCAAIHTRSPAAVARDVALLTGVELTCYRDEARGIVVLAHDADALIRHEPGRWRYEPTRGDPLRLSPIVQALRDLGRLDAAGFASDRDWWEATVDHTYPDPLRRLWRAAHDLFEHPPDVFVSLADGWYCGSKDFEAMMAAAATHGSLRADSSSAFVMSTAGELPLVLQMDELAARLRELGVPIPRARERAGTVSETP